MEERALAATFDLTRLPDDFHDDPYRYYRALRTHEPVRRMPDGSLFLTRHADLVAVYKDTTTFSSDKKKEFAPKFGTSPLFDHHTTSLVFNDPPLHTRVRKLVAGAFTPRHIQAMERGLRDVVDRLLDRMEAQGGEVDLIDDYAGVIPVEIIGNLLAVPPGDRAPLRAWSLAILGALEPTLDDAQRERGNRAVSEMLEYLTMLVNRRRARPGHPDSDVLTRLIVGEGQGEKLSMHELLHNCIFLLNAGHETTTNLIGNGLAALAAWPEQRALMRTGPDVLKTGVEELLRFESSNQLGNRISTCAGAIGDVAFGPDTRVSLCIGAANRDPEVFADPERLDVTRTPNRHLAFGSGPHQCVGMALGRLEGRVAIGKFLDRFPEYRIEGPVVRGRRARFRGYLHLPARLR
jgi:cytochrome P450